MTLDTIYQCFSGNTEDVKKARSSDILIAPDYPNAPSMRVVDFTITVDGRIVLLTEPI